MQTDQGCLEHLYAEEAQLRRSAEVRAQRLEHVHRVGERLKADLDEAEIGQRVAVAAREALGFRMVVLNLVDDPSNPASPWRVVATVGIPPEGVAQLCAGAYSIANVQALLRPEFRISRSYFIPEESEAIIEVSAVPRWRSQLDLQESHANAWCAGDELLVPLTDRDGAQLIGFLSVNDPEHGQRPSREEVELLEIFADQAVVALRNARLLALARAQAEQDYVTGLLNHRAGHRHLHDALAAAKGAGTPVGLLTIDLDGFKLINDTYGHATGDLALRHVADLLRRCARQQDKPVRLGGDEFALILPGASRAHAMLVAEQLIAVSREVPLWVPGTGAVPVHLSVGVASYPEDAGQADTLLASADAHLYEAKRATRTSGSPVVSRRSGEATAGGVTLLQTLLMMVDKQDGYTLAHAEQVATLACALATALGLSGNTVRSLRLAGLLHDVGMVGVPDAVLVKSSALDATEWMMLKEHVKLSVTLVQAALADQDLHMAIMYHHERWDGNGYPGGVAGPAIPLVGRILAIADAAAAMLQDRPHRRALQREAIFSELCQGAGTQFDPDLVEPLIRVFDVVYPARDRQV